MIAFSDMYPIIGQWRCRCWALPNCCACGLAKVIPASVAATAAAAAQQRCHTFRVWQYSSSDDIYSANTNPPNDWRFAGTYEALVDGDLRTGVSTVSKTPSWIQATFDRPRTISSFAVGTLFANGWYSEYIRSRRLYYWDESTQTWLHALTIPGTQYNYVTLLHFDLPQPITSTMFRLRTSSTGQVMVSEWHLYCGLRSAHIHSTGVVQCRGSYCGVALEATTGAGAAVLVEGKVQGSHLKVQAPNTFITKTGILDALGRGHAAGVGPGSPGRFVPPGALECPTEAAGAGGSHGGRGARGCFVDSTQCASVAHSSMYSTTAGANTTGAADAPSEFGSGGGFGFTSYAPHLRNLPTQWRYTPSQPETRYSAGGGIVEVHASHTAWLTSTHSINADGQPGAFYPADTYSRGFRTGGGAGGSIVVNAPRVAGQGLVSVRGGGNIHNSRWAGGGGGGRVLVVAEAAPPSTRLDVDTSGGDQYVSSCYGAAGSALLVHAPAPGSRSRGSAKLVFDNGGRWTLDEVVSPLPQLGADPRVEAAMLYTQPSRVELRRSARLWVPSGGELAAAEVVVNGGTDVRGRHPVVRGQHLDLDGDVTGERGVRIVGGAAPLYVPPLSTHRVGYLPLEAGDMAQLALAEEGTRYVDLHAVRCTEPLCEVHIEAPDHEVRLQQASLGGGATSATLRAPTVRLTAGKLTLNNLAGIVTDYLGYALGGPGAGMNVSTEWSMGADCEGWSTSAGGGAFGGDAGDSCYSRYECGPDLASMESLAGSPYGSEVLPYSLGSAGGAGVTSAMTYVLPQPAGGRLFVTADSIEFPTNQHIYFQSHGQSGRYTSHAGSGGSSGGSVLVIANTVTGSSTYAHFQANGGNAHSSASSYPAGGGSGGRVAVYVLDGSLATNVDIKVNGGTRYTGSCPGSVGTEVTDVTQLPLTAPTVPSDVTVTPGEGHYRVSWTAPDVPAAQQGLPGAAIMGYIVAHNGTASLYVTAERAGDAPPTQVLVGAERGMSMEGTFTVAAVNGAGVGAASAETAPTPVEDADKPVVLRSWPRDGAMGAATMGKPLMVTLWFSKRVRLATGGSLTVAYVNASSAVVHNFTVDLAAAGALLRPGYEHVAGDQDADAHTVMVPGDAWRRPSTWHTVMVPAGAFEDAGGVACAAATIELKTATDTMPPRLVETWPRHKAVGVTMTEPATAEGKPTLELTLEFDESVSVVPAQPLDVWPGMGAPPLLGEGIRDGEPYDEEEFAGHHAQNDTAAATLFTRSSGSWHGVAVVSESSLRIGPNVGMDSYLLKADFGDSNGTALQEGHILIKPESDTVWAEVPASARVAGNVVYGGPRNMVAAMAPVPMPGVGGVNGVQVAKQGGGSSIPAMRLHGQSMPVNQYFSMWSRKQFEGDASLVVGVRTTQDLLNGKYNRGIPLDVQLARDDGDSYFTMLITQTTGTPRAILRYSAVSVGEQQCEQRRGIRQPCV